MSSVMRDKRRGIRCNYNSINIFLQHVPISKQVSLYPSAFLSSNKLLSVLIIRPALRGGDWGREEAPSPKEEDFLKQKTTAIPITAMSENRGVRTDGWCSVFPFSICCNTVIREASAAPYSHPQENQSDVDQKVLRSTTKLTLLQRQHSQEHITANVPTG